MKNNKIDKESLENLEKTLWESHQSHSHFGVYEYDCSDDESSGIDKITLKDGSISAHVGAEILFNKVPVSKLEWSKKEYGNLIDKEHLRRLNIGTLDLEDNGEELIAFYNNMEYEVIPYFTDEGEFSPVATALFLIKAAAEHLRVHFHSQIKSVLQIAGKVYADMLAIATNKDLFIEAFPGHSVFGAHDSLKSKKSGDAREARGCLIAALERDMDEGVALRCMAERAIGKLIDVKVLRMRRNDFADRKLMDQAARCDDEIDILLDEIECLVKINKEMDR